MARHRAARAWLVAGAGIGGFFTFIAAVTIGTYAAAGSEASAGVGLAAGSVPASYVGLIQKWGSLCSELTPPLLAAQIEQESGFSTTARSGAGAEGIAQFMPATWATYGLDANGDGKADIWDPADAIPSMASYDCTLAKDIANVPGDRVSNMLAAYNAGAYAVIGAGGVPNISETQNYVTRIRQLAQSFTAAAPVSYSSQAAGAVYYAQTKLGTPYLWGGEGLASQGYRFDCSGLVQAAYASVGITLPRVAADQWYAGPHPSRDQLEVGDLVFFATDRNDPRTIHHVGIYVGGGYMINAPHTGAVIRYDSIDSEGDYFGATRVSAQGAAALPSLGTGNAIANGGNPAGAAKTG
jgi:cell wall-associated NlpC family hydrolase